MKTTPYLLQLRIQGIKNIKEPIQLDFYQKTVDKNFDPSKYKVKAIFGENGSGKTAIILSVFILQNILLNKSYLLDKDSQTRLVESINKHTKSSFIECEYVINTGEEIDIFSYRVDFSIRDDNRVHIDGELFQTKSNNSRNKYKKVFETKQGELIYYGNKDNFTVLQHKTQNLLEQQSFLTCVINNENYEIFKRDKMLIPLCLLVVFGSSIMTYLDETDRHFNYYLKQRIEDFCSGETSNENIKGFFDNNNHILNSFSDELYVPKDKYDNFEKRISKKCEFLKIFKPDLQDIKIEKKEYADHYRCVLKMVYPLYTIDKEFESRGIKKLIELYDCFDAASYGFISFIDELDSNINDVYLGKLIEYFVYYGEGQLCFTSHNLSPMRTLNEEKSSISFLSNINTIHTWTRKGNENPENAYKKGFIEDSPFNVDPSDFLGVLGGSDE